MELRKNKNILTGNWKLDYKVKGKNVSANEVVMANYEKNTSKIMAKCWMKKLMSKIGGDNA
jgi:hypothetical protein